MRPVPAHSTDLLYQGNFSRDELMEIGHALGVSDLKIITTATLKPERVLYHACLNGIQTYVKLNGLSEVERAKEIADMADTMSADLQMGFDSSLLVTQHSHEQRVKDASHFCEQLHAIEGAKSWDKLRYDNSWNINDYPSRWQKKAIETYAVIRGRIERGEYTPPDGQDAGSLTAYWSLRNLEYKHYRDVARNLVESYIHEQLPADQLLTMQPTTQRLVALFAGGMGSGKSVMTRQYVNALPEETRNDVVLHDADYLKYALYRSAVRDGLLPKDHCYAGPEVQAESSNALYEGTRKRAYLARQKFAAPNAIVNSIVLGTFETLEGIASGGKVVAHHLYISPEEAVIESEKRRKEIGRAPSEADIQWSTAASAKSLMLLTQPHYKGTDITAHLYHRKAGKAPRHYATIDAANRVLYVRDGNALAELSQSVCDSHNPRAALQQFLNRFTEAGFSVALVKDQEVSSTVAVLDSTKALSVHDADALNEHRVMKEALGTLAVSMGVASNAYPSFSHQKEILCR